MKKKYLYILIVCITGLVMSSCSTAKKGVKEGEKAGITKNLPSDINADMSFKMSIDDKNISVPGAIHMKRDKCIRLQLFMPFLGTEVGRLEFTPDYALLVDRMNKQYVKESYARFRMFGANVDFKTLQSLFWNDAEQAEYRKTIGDGAELVWTFDNLKKVDTKMYPCLQVISVDAADKKVKVTMKMSSLTTDADWKAESTVSDKYKQVDAETILKMLGQFGE